MQIYLWQSATERSRLCLHAVSDKMLFWKNFFVLEKISLHTQVFDQIESIQGQYISFYLFFSLSVSPVGDGHDQSFALRKP